MQAYELTLVLPEKATPSKKKAITSRVEKIVETNKGKIDKVDDWGLIKLAYTIDKNESGNFLHFKLELDSGSIKTLEDVMRREESIIRHLLVKADGSAGGKQPTAGSKQ